ncbi:MAG TPA: VanZ family protein [Blastocatellia bacterium]|jgi:VanZ family protein
MAESITTAESSLATKIIKYWLPVLVMIGAMYYASTDVFSGENTRGVIEKLVMWLRPHTTERGLIKINYLVRKAAHFIEYAMLAGLLFRAFRADSFVRWRLRWALYSFLIVVCWALLDEYHQSFTRTRGGSIRDSMLDCSGALFMLVVIALFNRRKRPGAYNL